MKNNRLYILAALLLAFIYACNMDDDLTEKRKIVPQKFTFKNLVVNHRFETPIGLIQNNPDDINGSTKGEVNIGDFSMDDIAEATGKSFKNYPYCSEENNFETDFKMIKADFPNLDEKEIIENEATIEQYYDINLAYEVLQKLKRTKKPTAKKEKTIANRVRLKDDPILGVGGGSSTSSYDPNCTTKMNGYSSKFWRFMCLKTCLLGYAYTTNGIFSVLTAPYSYTKAIYSLVTSSNEAGRRFKGQYYGYTYSSKFGQNDTVDAIRHIYWSALLARNYFTVSSKKPRLDFAKFVGDNNETCSTSNTDSSAMDYHNNAIGRALFDRLTTYKSRTIFWITVTYGLNIPSEYTLRREAIKILRTPSRKKYITTKGIPNDSKEHVKICFRKHAIEQTAKKKAVYFIRH